MRLGEAQRLRSDSSADARAGAERIPGGLRLSGRVEEADHCAARDGEFGAHVKSQIAYWGKVVRDSGIKLRE
jgi:hypothetical protein